MTLSRTEIEARIMSTFPKSNNTYICPACGSPVKISENQMHITCTNPNCSGKLYRRIEIMAKAFGIDNIGVKVAQELVEYLDLKNEHELLDLTPQDFLKVPRYKEGMANKLYESIHKPLNISWANFIRACQITRVGEGTAKDLATKYPTLEELLKATPVEMAKRMDGMTTNLTTMICQSIKDKEEEIRELYKRVTITAQATSTASKPTSIIAVVTGKLGFGSRPEFQRVFGASYGVKWASAVSKNTDILVTNEASTSTKYREATKIQQEGGKIKIMTEDEFIKFLGGTNTSDALLSSTAQTAQTLDMFADMDTSL